jgi:hypothetical protein
MRDGGGRRWPIGRIGGGAIWVVWAFASPVRILTLSNDWKPLGGIAWQRRGLKLIDGQRDTTGREETIRIRWSHKLMTAKER